MRLFNIIICAVITLFLSSCETTVEQPDENIADKWEQYINWQDPESWVNYAPYIKETSNTSIVTYWSVPLIRNLNQEKDWAEFISLWPSKKYGDIDCYSLLSPNIAVNNYAVMVTTEPVLLVFPDFDYLFSIIFYKDEALENLFEDPEADTISVFGFSNIFAHTDSLSNRIESYYNDLSLAGDALTYGRYIPVFGTCYPYKTKIIVYHMDKVGFNLRHMR